jgi:RNase H-like domain found in reverse transcriptase
MRVIDRHPEIVIQQCISIKESNVNNETNRKEEHVG